MVKFGLELIVLLWGLGALFVVNCITAYLLYRLHQKLTLTQYALVEYKNSMSNELAQMKLKLNQTVNTIKLKNFYK